MKVFGRFDAAIKWTKEKMYDYCYEVHTEKWQGKKIKDDDKFAMIEILNHSFSCHMVEDIKELSAQINPSIPWADDHFEERISGSPLNPPPSHEWWPYAQKNNTEFGGTSQFSHTYPERIWPKYAGSKFLSSDSNVTPHKGIRFNYGDFNDVINLLHKEPLTRQAFLPIWFPEDTGGANGERVPCFTGETEIQTDKGYLMIKDLTLENSVVTHNGRFRPIEKIITSDYKDNLLKIFTTNTNTPLNTTKDHPFLIIRNKGFLPSNPKFEWKEEWVKAKDIKKNDYVVHSFINDTDINAEFSMDLMRFFGYYLSEGEVLFDKRYGGKKPKSIRFNMSTKDKELGYIDDLIYITKKEFGKEPTLIQKKYDINDSKNIRIYIFDVKIAKKIYSIFGSGSFNKKIPEKILKYNKDYQLQLLIGYTRGDGSFEPNKKNIECTSVSPSIIFGLRTILFRNNIYNSLQKIPLRKPYFNKRLNRIIKPNYPSYKLTFSPGGRLSEHIFNKNNNENIRKIYKKDWIKSNRALFQIKSINEIKNNNINVYNLQIAEDNTYNTINCSVHNCTLGYHFIMRHGYLHVVYYIRSCDFFRHFRDDIYLCCRKVIWVLESLRKKDPDTWNSVKPGVFTMHITSLHAFKSEKKLLNK